MRSPTQLTALQSSRVVARLRPGTGAQIRGLRRERTIGVVTVKGSDPHRIPGRALLDGADLAQIETARVNMAVKAVFDSKRTQILREKQFTNAGFWLLDEIQAQSLLSADGECDLPTRHHAQALRPARLQRGRIVSTSNSISPDKLARPTRRWRGRRPNRRRRQRYRFYHLVDTSIRRTLRVPVRSSLEGF
jgi:hypothetical protein